MPYRFQPVSIGSMSFDRSFRPANRTRFDRFVPSGCTTHHRPVLSYCIVRQNAR
jgi:hypothetical protein